MESSKINVGLIGFGRMGSKYLRKFNTTGKYHFSYICDVDAEARAMARKLSPESRVVDNEDVIFNDDNVQCVILSTLANMRKEQIEKAVSRGKHIISEKPIADTPEREWAVVNCVEGSGLLSTVNLYLRNSWYHNRMKQYINEGEIGELAIIRVCHMTPGLANKLCIPSAKKVCCNFPETLKYLPADKAVLTGSPIREDLLTGDRLAGLQYTHLSASKPVLLVIGGSLGSVKVNTAIRKILPRLLESFQVIHVCGKGNLDDTLIGTPGYVQYEYVDKPLKHLFAAADLVVSRAGANSICELLALRKPNILIPLSAAASRGDQILNARSFAEQGFSAVLKEEQMTDRVLLDLIHSTYDGRRKYIEAMENSHLNNAVETIMNLINSCAAGQESAE